MFSLISQIATAARNRAAYRRTVAELSALPLDTALDINVYYRDIPAIAHRAVYGH